MGADIKSLAAKKAGCSDLVLPRDNEEEVKELTTHPIADLKGLLEVGFQKACTGPLKELPLDDGCCLGRCLSVTLCLKTVEGEMSVEELLLPIDCAIFPGSGDLIITGQVGASSCNCSSS